jgi:hypothetical protein
MSIAAATRKAFAVDAQAKSPEFRQAATPTTVESALEQITQWIPTEVVTIYVAILGIFAPSKASGKWIIFAIGAISVPVFVVLNASIVNKRGAAEWRKENRPGDPPKIAGKRLRLLVVVAAVAYLVWAWALPATPFLDLTDQATRVGGALVVVVALLMPKIAELFDLKLPTT